MDLKRASGIFWQVVASLLLFSAMPDVAAQTRWKAYDSILYENLFLPNFSNLLMPKGYAEVIVGTAIQTANTGWNNKSEKFDLGARYTFNPTTVIANFGVSSTNRFNAGVEIHYGIGYHDSEPGSSPFEIFKSSAPGYVQKASGLTSFGPRIKWRPIKNNPHLVYISTLQLPLISNNAAKNLLDSRVYWGNQLLYGTSPAKWLALFFQEDLYVYFKEGLNSHNQYYEGLSAYSYFLVTKHFYPFISVGYGGGFGTDPTTEKFRNMYTTIPVGAGLQYQFSMRFTFNVYYTKYLWAQEMQYDMKTVNVGLRGVF